MATIRVNWEQGKSGEGLIRAHQVSNEQPKCQFESMRNYSDYPDVETAEAAIKKSGHSKYKRCHHCWDGDLIDLIS